MTNIDLLDADEVQCPLLPPQSTDPASRYVTTLVRNGAGSYVDNAHVRMRALVIGGKVLPLIISEGRAGNSDVCSPYVHYVEYTLEEFARRNPRVPSVVLKALASPLAALLRVGSIDRVVFVNNWLLTANPSPALSASEITSLTIRLIEQYPQSAIVFRSVNPVVDRPGFEALLVNGYRLVRSGRVYLIDPGSRRYLEAQNVHTDLRLLRKSSYAVVAGPESLESSVPRLAQLYRDLNLGKHSWLNPQFNARFFHLTLMERVLTYQALVRQGRVDAFGAYLIKDGVMTLTFLGYDRRLPRRLGLYRMAFALVMDIAAEYGVLLHVGGGTGGFKLGRGAVPVEEYDAVYDRHLAAHRRLAWTTLRGLGRIGLAMARMREPTE